MRCAVHGVRMASRSFEGRWENNMPFSSSYHTCGPRSLAFAPARGLNMHRPVIDDSPCSHSLVFRALLREKEVKISNTSGRRRDVMLSLHVLARHNNNIGGSLHDPAPQQRRVNFLLRKPERMVLIRYCCVYTRTARVDNVCGCFCCQTFLLLHNHSSS